jgi:hemerythrin-like metal-binding protein
LEEQLKKLKWSRPISVYDTRIDAEHRALWEALGQLHSSIEDGPDPLHWNTALEAVTGELATHLAYEERRMDVTHYPLAGWHKKQHDTARAALAELTRRISLGDGPGAQATIARLQGWLHDHLAVTDRMLSAHLRAWDRLFTARAS